MIRRRLLAIVLMTTTAMTPVKADAAPLLGFIAGALGVGAATGLGATAAWAAGAAFASTVIGGIVVNTLVAIGLSAISIALTPRPQLPSPAERMVNFAQPVAYAEWVLGRSRKGGPLGFTGFVASSDVVTDTEGRKRHYSPILAAHPCHGIVTHYLDEREVDIDADGLVTTPPMAGFYRIRPFLGGAAQTADAELVNAFTEITAAHDFAGLTGAHIWAKRPPQEQFSEIYPNGRQGSYTPVLDGANSVYDPRDGSTGFTRNAALLLAYWVTQVLGRSVDWSEVGEEADKCDELVTNGDGGTQPKWRIDGVLSDDQEFEDQRAQMAAACDAWMYERPDGSVGFKVGGYTEPTITLTDEDLFGVEISEGQWGRGAPTEIAAQYVEPANNWRQAPSGTIILEETTRQVRDEPALYMVSSHNQAVRVIDRIARVKRARYQIKATCGLIGFKLRGHRFVRIQTLGIDEVFEIGEMWRNEGGFSYDLVANSVKPEDFEFDAATQEPKRPAFKGVQNDNGVEDVTGLSGVAQDGGGILYSWPQQDESLQQQIRFRRSGTSDWQKLDVPQGDGIFLMTGLQDLVSYEAQIRNRTSAGRSSDWSASETVLVLANSVAPLALDSFAVAQEGADTVVTFDAPDDQNYHATRIFRADYASGHSNPPDFNDASLIRPEYGHPGNPDSHTDTGLASGHFAYWGIPINASGVAGPTSGPVTIDIA
ncbi:hypothetical protein [Sulfitobacter geojensis]|uniref:hypothetical protein n=1 Tax=Sulfitobacter geojensis TaxID=1342299 RepID=UPI003BACD767